MRVAATQLPMPAIEVSATSKIDSRCWTVNDPLGRRLLSLCCIVLSGCSASPAVRYASPYSTAWVKEQIASYEMPNSDKPSQVTRTFMFAGKRAYLIPSPCCDRFDYLYDSNGVILCAPSGGFGGRGDGSCPDVLANADARDQRLFALGHRLSISFLESITAPVPNDEVVIIHAELGAAIVIRRDVAADYVDYLRGNGFLWAAIAEQLAGAAGRGERIRLDIQRWELEIPSCPSLPDKISAFMARLDDTLSDLGGASATDGEIVVDGPSFLIQMAAKDASLTITPSAAFDPPLQQAASELHSVISRCAASREPEIEPYEF